MNKRVKGLLAVTCCIVLVVASILGTVAYMTDRTAVTNTFTVGEVDIKLDEAKVDVYGEPVPSAPRVETGNEYKLIPGMTYTKDPTVTVLKGSEESYVRMLLTLNCKSELDAVFAPGVELTDIFGGYDSAKWIFQGETQDTDKNTVTYEFRYVDTVETLDPDADKVLEPLFTSLNVPGTVTGEQLKTLEALEIKVEGHAIQAATFADANAAWAAFDTQMNS